MQTQNKKVLLAFEKLLKTMDNLREKCPWDKKQTFESLRHLTIEETYELCDAILEQHPKDIEKELGDLLLHIVFYAKIGSEKKWFDMQSIISEICKKLIYRHPHIYGSVQVKNEKEVAQNWERLKLNESNKKTVLQGVPKSLPALVKAFRIQEKAANVGFDWQDKTEVFDKIQEELKELQEAISEENQRNTEEEFGDVLFSMINYARFLKINPENALEKTNKKFIKRFGYIEKAAQRQGKNISALTLKQMDDLWNEAKKLS